LRLEILIGQVNQRRAALDSLKLILLVSRLRLSSEEAVVIVDIKLGMLHSLVLVVCYWKRQWHTRFLVVVAGHLLAQHHWLRHQEKLPVRVGNYMTLKLNRLILHHIGKLHRILLLDSTCIAAD